jgi:hypothetical protein
MKVLERRVGHLWFTTAMVVFPLVAWAAEELLATPVVLRLVEFQGALKDAERKEKGRGRKEGRRIRLIASHQLDFL